MLRGYIGEDIWRRYLPDQQTKRQPKWDRFLYLLVGFFFIAAEMTYFLTNLDWFNPSTYR